MDVKVSSVHIRRKDTHYALIFLYFFFTRASTVYETLIDISSGVMVVLTVMLLCVQRGNENR